MLSHNLPHLAQYCFLTITQVPHRNFNQIDLYYNAAKRYPRTVTTILAPSTAHVSPRSSRRRRRHAQQIRPPVAMQCVRTAMSYGGHPCYCDPSVFTPVSSLFSTTFVFTRLRRDPVFMKMFTPTPTKLVPVTITSVVVTSRKAFSRTLNAADIVDVPNFVTPRLSFATWSDVRKVSPVNWTDCYPINLVENIFNFLHCLNFHRSSVVSVLYQHKRKDMSNKFRKFKIFYH